MVEDEYFEESIDPISDQQLKSQKKLPQNTDHNKNIPKKPNKNVEGENYE